MKTTLGAAIFAALCTSAISQASPAEIAYTVTQIQSLPNPSGRPLAVVAGDPNGRGQVVGWMYDLKGAIHTDFGNGFITGPNGIGLHLLVGPSCHDRVLAYGVNDSGQVTGIFGRPGSGQAFLSEPNGGALHPLGGPGRAADLVPIGVNNRGQVTGYTPLPNGTETHAFLTTANGEAVKDLGTLGGTFSAGLDVNDEGQVTGYAYIKGFEARPHAFLSEPDGGTLHDLGTLGGRFSFGNGVNEAGQVVGFSGLPRGVLTHAFLSGPDGGPLLDLGTLGGSYSAAYGINDLGDVVGDSYTAGNRESHAFVYFPSIGMKDLNDLIDPQLGLELIFTGGINNRGQIVATAIVDGRQQAFLLTPIAGVPDGGSTAMLLTGALASLLVLRRCFPV